MMTKELQRDVINALTPDQVEAIVEKYRHRFPVGDSVSNYTAQRVACVECWADECLPVGGEWE